MNLGLGSGDDVERVRSNRRRACAALGIEPFSSPGQVHGSRVVRVGPKRKGAGFGEPASALAGVDAVVTSSRRMPLAILTADCVPVAMCDPAAGTFAVAHAGWRGLVAGVLQATLRVFDDPSRVKAIIGPAIGPDHYEVGEDVALAVAAASSGGVRTRRQRGRLLLDLPGAAATILKESGVRAVAVSGECTACDPDRFYSHRRDGLTGRHALIATRL